MSNTKKNQNGVSLYLAIVVLSVLTASLLTIVSIAVSQIKVVYKIGDSVFAFYAADSGIERLLYEVYVNHFNPYDNLGVCPFSDTLEGASFEVCVSDLDGSKVSSKGVYKNMKRTIEVSF